MNVVDVGILVVVGFFAVGGLRRGFLLGLVDLAAFVLALIVAARVGGSVAAPLIARDIPNELAMGAGYLIAAVVSLAVIGLAVRVLLAPLGALGAGTPLGWFNSVLGLLPGALRGLAIAALALLLAAAAPAELGWRDDLAISRLAAPVMETGRRALDAGLTWAGIDPRALGIP